VGSAYDKTKLSGFPIQASIFLAHALIRWCLVRDEYLAKMGKDEDAILFRPREQQMLDLLDRFFPISEQDAQVTDEAAAPYRDFELTHETIKERQPVSSSGWMNYLRNPELWGETGDGQTPEERREELLDNQLFLRLLIRLLYGRLVDRAFEQVCADGDEGPGDLVFVEAEEVRIVRHWSTPT
jgi:hypothetical protein